MKRLIMILALAFLLLAPASAFLNVKDYDAVNKIITIKDWWGLSSYLQLKLISNTNQCLTNDCEAILKLTPAQDMKPEDAISQTIKFIDKGGYDISGRVSYSINVEQNIITKSEVAIWGTCEDEKTINKTTGKPVQYPCKTGNKEQSSSRIDLVNLYDFGTLKANTNYIIHIKAIKPINVAVDWQVKAGGISITEFSWFDTNWLAKKDITITNPSSSPRNKEIFIFYLNDTDINSQANAMRSDIRIINNTGGVVPHQLIYYRQNQTADAVLFLTNYMAGSSSVNYSIYYNNTLATASNVTLFSRYDFFENATFEWNGDGRGIFDSYDTWTKLSKETTTIKNPAGTQSLQSLKGIGNDATANIVALGIVPPFRISFWYNPDGAFDVCDAYAQEVSGANRHGLCVKSTTGIIRLLTDGTANWVDTTYKLDSTSKWYWFTYEVNSTGEYYYYTNDTGLNYMGADNNGGYINFGDSYVLGEATGGTTIYDDMLVANGIAGFDWYEYVTPSSFILSPEQHQASGVLTTTLHTPADYYNTTSTSTFFNCSATAGSGNTLKNATLTIYTASGGTTSYFEAIAGNPTNYQLNRTQALSENGVHKWNCKFEDSTGLAWATNRTITIDNVAPIVTYSYPPNSTTLNFLNTGTYNFTLLSNSSDATAGVQSCWVNNGTTNVSYVCNTPKLVYVTTGLNTITLYSNDTLNNIGTNSTSVLVNSLSSSATYQSTINEGEIQTLKLSFTSTLPITSLTGNLTYYSVVYPATAVITNPTNAYLTNSITTPMITADNETAILNWTYVLNGGSATTIDYSQLILNVALEDCSAGKILIINYTLYDEKTKDIVSINNTGSIIEYDLNLTSWTNPAVTFGIHKKKIDTNNVTICLPIGVLNASSYRLDGVTEFSSFQKVTEYHFFTKANISLTNIPKAIPLYDLASNQSTSFLVTYQDENYIYIKDAIIDVWRYYVGDGQYLSVENAKTDNSGQTSVHLVTEDVLYQFLVWKDGLLQYTSQADMKALCQATPCQINFKKEVSGNGTASIFDNIIYSFDLNQTTHIALFTYAINDGTSSTMNMTIMQGDIAVCSQQATSSGGTLSCTIPTGFLNSTSTIYVYKDGKLIGMTSWDFKPNAFSLLGYTGIILTALIFLMLSLMMISSGIATIVFGIASLGFLGLMQIFATGNTGLSLAIIWLAVAGGIIIWKINKRRIS